MGQLIQISPLLSRVLDQLAIVTADDNVENTHEDEEEQPQRRQV